MVWTRGNNPTRGFESRISKISLFEFWGVVNQKIYSSSIFEYPHHVIDIRIDRTLTIITLSPLDFIWTDTHFYCMFTLYCMLFPTILYWFPAIPPVAIWSSATAGYVHPLIEGREKIFSGVFRQYVVTFHNIFPKYEKVPTCSHFFIRHWYTGTFRF